MAQATDFTLANQPGAGFRSELNTILAALASAQSGPSAPPLMLAGMLWSDTGGADALLRMRNPANGAWITISPQAFGLGITGAPSLASLDAITESGFYMASSGATGSPAPVEAYRVMHIAGTTGASASQMAIGAASGRVWMRLRLASSWGAWGELLVGGLTTAQIAAAALRTSGEGFASLLDTELPTAAWVKAFIDSNPWTYTSTTQTITSGSALTLAHGLGARPTEVRLVVRCTTAQAPYAVGDEVECTDFSGANQWGASIAADATNLVIRTGAGGHFLINNSGAAVALTNGSWRYIARAR